MPIFNPPPAGLLTEIQTLANVTALGATTATALSLTGANTLGANGITTTVTGDLTLAQESFLYLEEGYLFAGTALFDADIALVANNGVAAIGKTAALWGGQGDTGFAGGRVIVEGGWGTTTGAGGAANVLGGAGGDDGAGGTLTLKSGAGGGTSGASGVMTQATGSTTAGASGDIFMQTGNALGGNSGHLYIDTGSSDATGGTIYIGTFYKETVSIAGGGEVNIGYDPLVELGAGTSAGTNVGTLTADAATGALVLRTGNAGGGNSGAITLDTGTATGTTGTITIGGTNASALAIGRNGVTTTFTGTSSVTILDGTITSDLLVIEVANPDIGLSRWEANAMALGNGTRYDASGTLVVAEIHSDGQADLTIASGRSGVADSGDTIIDVGTSSATPGNIFIGTTTTPVISIGRASGTVIGLEGTVRVGQQLTVGSGMTSPTGTGDFRAGNGTSILYWDASIGSLALTGGSGASLGYIMDQGFLSTDPSLLANGMALWSNSAAGLSAEGGRQIYVRAGAGDGVGAGGDLTLESGAGGASGNGGALTLIAGAGGGTNGVINIGPFDASAVNISRSAGTLGFFGATAAGQESDSVALTDSSGGTADGTVAAVSGSGADADINNNFAELTTKYNALRDFARAHGLMA